MGSQGVVYAAAIKINEGHPPVIKTDTYLSISVTLTAPVKSDKEK